MDAEKIGLQNLFSVSDSFHFRFWIENQAVEVWTNDFKKFYGIVSNYTTKIENDSSQTSINTSNKFYSNKVVLNTTISREVYYIFRESGIFELPTYRKIKDWRVGMDGDGFITEMSTPYVYSFKTYEAPVAQQKLSEAIKVLKLNKQLRQKLKMEDSWKTFLEGLPKGCYRCGQLQIDECCNH